MRILIIEDEAKTVDFLGKGLTENGYSVETARDGDTVRVDPAPATVTITATRPIDDPAPSRLNQA